MVGTKICTPNLCAQFWEFRFPNTRYSFTKIHICFVILAKVHFVTFHGGDPKALAFVPADV